MRPADDFEAYVVARWPELVRTLALLGCPDVLAPDVAADALVRCRGSWTRTRAEDDVEVAVHAELLDAWERRRHSAWWVGLPPVEPEPDRAAVEDELDRLDESTRAALVLAEVAGLDDFQVAEILGAVAPPRAGARAGPEPADLRAVAARVEVPQPAVAAVAGRARTSVRRARVAVVVVSLGALLAAVVLAWSLSRRDEAPADATDPTVASGENPAPVAWYADGVLHLDRVEVTIPGLRDLVTVRDGVVLTDLAGRVVHVDGEGRRTDLGHTYPSVDLVASADRPWVAWADTARGRLVVRDLDRDADVVTLGGGVAVPVAIDDLMVYYRHRGQETSGVLDTRDGSTRRVPGLVLDQQAGTVVLRAGPRSVRVERHGDEAVVEADSARLSRDGTLVLARTGRERSVRLYDASSGRELEVRVGGDEIVLDAELGPGRLLVMFVGRAVERDNGYVRLSGSGSVDLRSCRPESGQCVVEATLGGIGRSTLLAH